MSKITVDDLVQLEVKYCVSSLIHTLGTQSALTMDHDGNLVDLCEQALELRMPIDDWEDAARQEGWYVNDDGAFSRGGREFATFDGRGKVLDNPEITNWQELCEAHDIEPYCREIFEHWAVSNWLGEQLEARGERVNFDFEGLVVWGRTTTGQAISQDAVIQEMHGELVK